MHNIRFGLLCAAGVILFFLWRAWNAEYPRQPDHNAPAVTQQAQTQQPGDASDLPDIASAPKPAHESSGQSAAGHNSAATQSESHGKQAAAQLKSGQPIHVVTDKYKIKISTRGGTLRRVTLRGIAASDAHPDKNLVMMRNTPSHFFIAQSGLIGKDKHSPPSHNTLFTADKTKFHMAHGQDTLQVPLHWQDADGHLVTKVYTFHRGSYEIRLTQKITNQSTTPWTVSQYLRFWREPFTYGDSKTPFARQMNGVVWYKQKGDKGDYKYEKIKSEDLADNPVQVQQTGGWMGIMQHYFLAAVIPPKDARVSYFAKPKNTPDGKQGYSSGYISAQHTIAPGDTGNISANLFLGIKLHNQLAATKAAGLPLTVDYGYITFLAKPIFWILSKLHALVGNWGLAILLLTVLIKLAFFKLSETQYRSMARMKKFGPRIKQIKEQYGDDKEKMQSKMMDLYKKEGFNPLGGCWPMLVQMPIFIALYYVLRQAPELRHAPFIFWIHDLSSPDPYYILPVLFGISMYFQQKLSSSAMAMQEMQKRMMQIMPVGMAVFFAFYPVGLVIYWLTSNLISITQQWFIYRKLDREGLGKSAAGK